MQFTARLRRPIAHGKLEFVETTRKDHKDQSFFKTAIKKMVSSKSRAGVQDVAITKGPGSFAPLLHFLSEPYNDAEYRERLRAWGWQ